MLWLLLLRLLQLRLLLLLLSGGTQSAGKLWLPLLVLRRLHSVSVLIGMLFV